MSEATAGTVSGLHPVRLRVTDDLRRTRLTVFFRLVLAIPHFLWVGLLTVIVVLAVFANWFATLFAGLSPMSLHNFLAGYLRNSIHVTAYLFLIADPYPGFYLINLKADYPVDLEVDPPVTQNRWTVGFRVILAIPAMLGDADSSQPVRPPRGLQLGRRPHHGSRARGDPELCRARAALREPDVRVHRTADAALPELRHRHDRVGRPWPECVRLS